MLNSLQFNEIRIILKDKKYQVDKLDLSMNVTVYDTKIDSLVSDLNTHMDFKKHSLRMILLFFVFLSFLLVFIGMKYFDICTSYLPVIIFMVIIW
jgi:hypothetical protein